MSCTRTAVAATACLVTFLLEPAAGLGRPNPSWYMNLQCVALAAAFLLGLSSAVCTRLPSSVPVLACLPALSFGHAQVVAPPAARFRVCPGASPHASSCFAHVRSCVQGRCGGCLPGSGVTYDLFSFNQSSVLFCSHCAACMRTDASCM